MLHKTKRNKSIIRALAATKHDGIIEEYATMESIYIPPSQFSGGFSKTMECVEMTALVAVNKGFREIGAEEYRWVNAVIDEETGDVMDLEKLLKHPKYIEAWTLAAANEYERLFQGCGRNQDGTQRVVGTN